MTDYDVEVCLKCGCQLSPYDQLDDGVCLSCQAKSDGDGDDDSDGKLEFLLF